MLGGTVSGGNFTDINQLFAAAYLTTNGHTVTQIDAATIAAVPTLVNCDLVLHVAETASLATALRATTANAAPVLECNAGYLQNVNGGIAMLSGAGGTWFFDSNMRILATTPTWTDDHQINDVVNHSAIGTYFERAFTPAAGGVAYAEGNATGHDVGWIFPAGTTNLAGVATTARVAVLTCFSEFRHFNTVGTRLFADVMNWAAFRQPTVSAFGPQILWPGRSSTIQGTNFGATQGTGQVTINIAGNRTAVQTITAWSDTSITFTTVLDDGVNEPIQAFPDEVAVKVENEWGGEMVLLGLVVTGPEMHYHGAVQTGVHLAFDQGPRQFSNLPDNVLWTDITSKVRGFNYTRGRQHELGLVQAGTATIALSNNDGAFNEHNTQSPYHPNIRPLIPVRIVAAYIEDLDGGANDWEFHRLWSGYVESWPVTFPNRADSVVVVTCSDLFKALALSLYGARPWGTLLDPPSGGPEAWWRFSGAAANVDESGNGHTLTWSGSPVTQRPGVWSVDQGVLLDGVNDFATAALEADLEIRDDMSIEFWFKPDATTPAEGECIVSVKGTDDLYTIVYDDGSLIFYPTDAGGGGAFLAYQQLTPGQWHHVVVTIAWGAYREIICYVDGELQSSAIFPFLPAVGVRTFRIGSFDGTQGWFSGDLSELAIWTRVLSGVEASEHYDSGFESLPVEDTDERVQRLMDLYVDGDAEVRFRSSGITSMQGRAPAGATLSEIQTTVATESGLFYIDGEGIPTFEGRHYRILDEPTPRATFGPNDLPYQSLVLSFDDSELDNLIRVTPGDGEPTAVAVNASSVDRYGTRVREVTVYPEDRNEGLQLAAWLLALRADPATRVRSIDFKLGATPALWDVVLGAELSNRYQVSKAMAGDDFTQDVFIEAIQMTVSSSKEWSVSWQLSPTNTQTFWVLGEVGFSELGETTRLGY